MVIWLNSKNVFLSWKLFLSYQNVLHCFRPLFGLYWWIEYKLMAFTSRYQILSTLQSSIFLRQTACLVVNPIRVSNFAFLFKCMLVGWISDSMRVPTLRLIYWLDGRGLKLWLLTSPRGGGGCYLLDIFSSLFSFMYDVKNSRLGHDLDVPIPVNEWFRHFKIISLAQNFA